MYKNILVTGGAGFVGSNLCIKLKEHYPSIRVVALDNLVRRGSELNLPRLKAHGVEFIHGDVRKREDLQQNKIDLIIECSAEPSVMAGVTSSPEYVLDTNLVGAINCFELARKNSADVIFLSTSRVYPIRTLNKLHYREEKTRFALTGEQNLVGVSEKGISENFPLDGVRSLYGTTKLAAELLLQEYRENYGIKVVTDRFGLITGPWQMSKSDQGVITLWMARHIFNKPLSYIGFEGSGKQVRDMIHIDDVYDILHLQMQKMGKFDGEIYNIGGGVTNSVSLLELTDYCQNISGKKITIKKDPQTRPGDIAIYVSDTSKILQQTGWLPKKTVSQTLKDIHKWIIKNKDVLQHVLE